MERERERERESIKHSPVLTGVRTSTTSCDCSSTVCNGKGMCSLRPLLQMCSLSTVCNGKGFIVERLVSKSTLEGLCVRDNVRGDGVIVERSVG